ncbi:MAG: hypothetical protein E6J29_01950 [Chloroflexi bacterium]|nr:MAG: hypothetical protein E6J29_01950 [Chloroflexota bacterium]TMD52659.1 MAG: hypothetical protein E6I85_09995 [Chloroflexota bacterium]
MENVMSLPCSHCGGWNRVSPGAEGRATNFNCSHCGAANSLQQLRPATVGVSVPAVHRAAVAPQLMAPARRAYGSPAQAAASKPTSHTKRMLVSLLAVAAIAMVANAAGGVGGTFATFNATTTNNSSIQTGTLVLSNKVNAGSACLSYTTATISAANSNACDVLWNLSGASALPGATATADLTLLNQGNLTPSSFKLFANGSCTDAAVNDTFGNHGGGLLCSQVQVVIYQSNNTFTTLTSCVYGVAAAGSPINNCSWDSAHTLADVGTNHQSGAAWTLTNLSGNTAEYFVVAISLPATTDNTFQGRSAGLQLNWQIVQ